MLLSGRVAVVTGAGRGIGREFALCLAREGAKVVVNDVGATLDGHLDDDGGVDDSPAAQVCKEIESFGGEAVPAYDSVSDFEAAGRIIGTAVDTFGQIDIVDVTLHHRILQVVVQAFRRRLIGVMWCFSQRAWAML